MAPKSQVRSKRRGAKRWGHSLALPMPTHNPTVGGSHPVPPLRPTAPAPSPPRMVQQSYRAGRYTSCRLLSTSHRAASWTPSEDKQLLPHPCSGGAAEELWCLCRSRLTDAFSEDGGGMVGARLGRYPPPYSCTAMCVVRC